MMDREPVDAALRRPGYTPEQKRRLRLIREVKAYGASRLGLRDTGSYETLYDTRGRPIAWNLVACPPDSVRPRLWHFFIVGTLPYIGFFDRADAEREEALCRARGDDTLLRPVAAYSTLGWFSDPVLTTMLDDDDAELAELILHEMTHGTVFHKGHGDFNESLATFTGEEAAVLFLKDRDGEGAASVRAARTGIADARRFAGWVEETWAALRNYYAQSMPRAEKIAGRQAVFDRARRSFDAILFETGGYRGYLDRRPLSNAFVAAHHDYTSHTGLFEAVVARHPQGLRGLIELASRPAAVDDPVKYLR